MQSIPVDAVTNPRSVLATNTLKKIRGLALGTSSSPSESDPANLERSSLRDMVRCRGGEGNQLIGMASCCSIIIVPSSSLF